jgi:hypothetical protein
VPALVSESLFRVVNDWSGLLIHWSGLLECRSRTERWHWGFARAAATTRGESRRTGCYCSRHCNLKKEFHREVGVLIHRLLALTLSIKKQAGALCKAPARNNSLIFQQLFADFNTWDGGGSHRSGLLASARSECEASKSGEDGNNFCKFHSLFRMCFLFISRSSDWPATPNNESCYLTGAT